MKIFKTLAVLSLLISAATAHADNIKIKIRNNSGHDFYFNYQYSYFQDAPKIIANGSTADILSPNLTPYLNETASLYYFIQPYSEFKSLKRLIIYLTLTEDDKVDFTSGLFINGQRFSDNLCAPQYDADRLVALDCNIQAGNIEPI